MGNNTLSLEDRCEPDLDIFDMAIRHSSIPELTLARVDTVTAAVLSRSFTHLRLSSISDVALIDVSLYKE